MRTPVVGAPSSPELKTCHWAVAQIHLLFDDYIGTLGAIPDTMINRGEIPLIKLTKGF